MKRTKQILLTSFCTLLVAVATGCSDLPKVKESSIDVGQTWKYTENEDNPYEKVETTYKEVIEITGEYVLYIKDGKDTLNEKKYWFVVGSECVSNCN